MLRCFDCNNAADDGRALVDDGSWTSTTAPNSMQHTVVTEEKSMLSTEYKLKFQDFSGRCEADGPTADSGSDGAAPGLGRAKTWYSDLIESRRKAVTYKVRGWGKESAPAHLVYLYDQAEDPSRPPDKKIISALYLETLQPGLSRECRGRTPAADSTGSRSGPGTADSADSRGRSGAPPAAAAVSRSQSHATARKSTAGVKADLKLHITDRKGRPGGAQRVGAKTPGDEVDRVKGRSPSTPRGPPSHPPSQARRKSPGPKPPVPLRVAAASGGPQRTRPVSARAADETDGGASLERPVAVRRPPAPVTTAAAEPAAAGRDESSAAVHQALAALTKSPPEPTRVRSPEDAAALRSPEAVNWTLPLDTARAFTVTQNVGSGYTKPQSGRPRSSHSQSSGQSQISPLHRQLVTEAMASRSDPPPGWSAVPSSKPADGPASPTPPLVRPTDATPSEDKSHLQLADGPTGAQLFSAGSAAPPRASVMEMPGSGKSVQVGADSREAPPYHVI